MSDTQVTQAVTGLDGSVYHTPISAAVFNFEKTDYEGGDMFFGQESGLVDTATIQHPYLERLYKKLKALDWDENEFDFMPHAADFKRMDRDLPGYSDPMIKQLGWQWETDSIAAKLVSTVMSGFLTDTNVMDLYAIIGTNERVHARTYSEIERFCFDEPDKVKKSVVSLKQNAQRLETVAKVFEQAFITSHKLALGQVKRDQASFDIFYLFVIAMFLMERGQFVISFATTFTYGAHGWFMQICKAVQKICQDEYEIHGLAGAYMFDKLSQTSAGIMAYARHRDTIKKMTDEVLAAELRHQPFLMGGLDNIFGVTVKDYQDVAYYFFKDIYEHLRIPYDFVAPKRLPLDFLKKWMSINGIQAAWQEEDNGAYLLGMRVRDDTNTVFDITGI